MTAGVVRPPEDHERSSRTGWTRSHWEAVADLLLDGVSRYASPHHALLDLPGPRPSSAGARSDAFEGFARTFLLAAFRMVHAPDDVREPLAERYADGVVEGTRPGSAEAWPVIADRSQSMVEAASVAIALHESRPWVWDRLPAAVQNRVVDYLSAMARHETHPNNWVLFPVIALRFLESVGAPGDPRRVERALDRVDGWYRGDGWYTDGGGPAATRYDYYVGWALHFYSLMWCRMGGAEADPRRAARIRGRVRAYNAFLTHLIGADGAPVLQGRSLTYRAAVAAPLLAAELADAPSVPPGLARRAASGVLRHFVDRGLLDGGTLTLGWHGEHLPLVQGYSGPASPYWISKAFAGLALPVDHPVWTAPEELLPVERGDFTVVARPPGWVAYGTRADGVVRLLNHGTSRSTAERAGWADDDDALYGRLAYSTATAPVTGAGPAIPTDNDAVLLDGDRPLRRTRPQVLALGEMSASRWVFADGGPSRPTLDLLTLTHGALELRVHLLSGVAGLRLVVTGYALADAAPVERPGWALAGSKSGAVSGIAPCGGPDNRLQLGQHSANALGAGVLVPTLLTEPLSTRAVVPVLVVLGGDQSAIPLSPVTVVVDGETLDVRWPDGRTQVVQL